MPREVLHYLQLAAGLTVIDGTVGAGGHSSQILDRIRPDGRLIGFDRDPMMLAHARQKLTHENTILVHSSYTEAPEFLNENDINPVDRVLLDLGLSSDQLADRNRGFGFDAGGPLDMRFDTSRNQSAAEYLARTDQKQLEKTLADFGEEPFARQIAEAVCKRRGSNPIETTQDLEECVRVAVPRNSLKGNKNPATRVFQALRIAVNDELEHVQRMVDSVLPAIVKPGGIVVILTFHSLEDRIVKNAFKGQKQWTALTPKPVEATPAEIRLNPRSRSAKLRAAKLKAAAPQMTARKAT